jgi:hypothetical protein
VSGGIGWAVVEAKKDDQDEARVMRCVAGGRERGHSQKSMSERVDYLDI